MNTAAGVSTVPQDYLNVARVLKLSEWKVFTTILFPSVLPHLMTGIRLSIGVAWLVIVAAEMLTGGVGLGFWVWDEWNNLNVEHIIVAHLRGGPDWPGAGARLDDAGAPLPVQLICGGRGKWITDTCTWNKSAWRSTPKGRFVALQNVNLDIAQGEFISLIGHPAVANPPC